MYGATLSFFWAIFRLSAIVSRPLRTGTSSGTAMACKRSPWRTSRRPTRTAGFPVIFVDEGQDTDPAFVDALREVAQAVSLGFCLGFFGDPEQKIYMQGAGQIPPEEGWEMSDVSANLTLTYYNIIECCVCFDGRYEPIVLKNSSI
ncbi:UvrD-helicase domain-containing protein [Ruegeria faecimaris]|uniref:UvrD-helicase domain-containing protein n=1 Tax=Ruegeria faecimaris TaxID=686389 RepID=UPI00115B3371|nr:UvrD-helicase domain-containing protein [Ruegeria faecimaris]